MAEENVEASENQPPCMLCIGMAGSGKTTFVQRLYAHLYRKGDPCYVVNLDPAVINLPYDPHIDIRDTVDYKQVMQQYGLGPNGGIVTSLNLFATKFDEVLGLVEKRSKENKYVLFDTPGQIEVFTWSASGQIITEALASTLPTVLLYVIDTPRCVSPITFMSNMLYACSILYKTRLPFVLVFNKTDIVSHEFAVNWMKDYDSIREALSNETAYIATLARSMSLVLEEFYQNLRVVGVSSMTGEGIDDLLQAVEEAKQEYLSQYRPLIDKLKSEKEGSEKRKQEEALRQIAKDLDEGGSVVLDARAPLRDDDLQQQGELEARAEKLAESFHKMQTKE